MGREGRAGPCEALSCHPPQGWALGGDGMVHGLGRLHAARDAGTGARQCPRSHPGPPQPLVGWGCAHLEYSNTGTCHPEEEGLLPTAQRDLSNWAPLLSLNICEYHFGNRLYWILDFLFKRESLSLFFRHIFTSSTFNNRLPDPSHNLTKSPYLFP